MTDPLSALLGSKKKDEKTAPAPKKAASSLFGEASKMDAIASIGSNLLDVTASLGGARRNAPSGSGPLERTTSPPPASASLFDSAATSVPSPRPPAQAPASVAGGLSSALAQLNSGAVPAPAGGAGAFDDMLEGEKIAVNVKKCWFKVSNPLCEVPGRLLCTNYRLKFQNVKGGLREELRWMLDCKYFDVPMGTLEELKVDSKVTVTGAMEVSLRITTKDCRMIYFLMNSEEECRDVLSAVSSFSHPGNPTLLFAVKYCEELRKKQAVQDGWDLYNPMEDYARMGIDTDLIPNPSCPWKVSKLNNSYGLCSTYPANLVLPRQMADHEIRAVASFRKRGRLPSLSWCGGPALNYASVWRCSQTTEGLMGTKSPEDEKHVQCIREGSRNPSRDLLVIDLRPWKAAWANKAGGGGFEGYGNCNLIFGGIDNIHAVRDAWRAMIAATGAIQDGEVGSWIKDVANSNWYDYIGAIMNCARKVIVEILDTKSNVMVHCSDGWDRTAQTTSLAMLCIDPHYRTQTGFLKLIQKEWCSFGHKFRTRLALGEAPTSEYCPVIMQWLEAVYQVVMQNPNIFEFSPALLLRLTSEVTSNRYGTFLCDCERERLQSVSAHTVSLWSVLLSPSEKDSWRNMAYQRSDKPFIPSVSQACFNIWEGYWFRYQKRGEKFRAQASTSASPALVRENSGSFAPEASATAPEPLPTGGKPLNPLNPLAPSAPAAPAAEPPPREKETSLFAPEEVVKAPITKPIQYFNDDDDDEDVFSKKK